MSLSTLAIIAKLYEDFVRIHLGLDVQTTIFILIPLYIIGSVCAGYLDFRYGIYKIESDISYRAAPLSDKMRLDIIEIKELLLCLNNKK